MKRIILFFGVCSLLFFTSLDAQNYVPEKNNDRIRIKPFINIQAFAFNLRDVRLLNSPFKNAMKQDSIYLLSLEPDRLLNRFHLNAGLAAKGAVYGGWESEGVSGHTMGHYLSALSMMYASTGENSFSERVNYIVDELSRCQQARKTGYVGAIPGEDSIFGLVAKGQIRSSGFDLNGGWSPWYTVHKLMAGLVDAYYYCGSNKALDIVTGMSAWVENTLKGLNDEQLQKMLTCEYGGMNDVLASVYAITGKRKYLELSYKFHDNFVLGKLAQHIDPMPGKHSNTNVPKAIGCANRYELTGSDSDKTIASFFWTTMVGNHSYVIGGNSNYEYCGEPNQLNDRLSDNTCETCNTYNMLKLTRHLFTWHPDGKLADFYERALYNHILASQNPSNGMMCYFVPLRMGTKKQFSDPFNTFTCCVGTGIENHTKYTESIYYEGKDGSLFVNLFIPSVLSWRERGIVLRQESAFPENGNISFFLEAKSPQKFTLNIRKPWWAVGEISLKVNGNEVRVRADTTGYLQVNRTWKGGDKIELFLAMSLHTESMPDNRNRIALLYGPLVLAGRLGTKMPDPVLGTPVLLTNDRNVNDWVKPVQNETLTFEMKGIGKPFDATLIPFYKMYDEYYSVYWDYFTDADWSARQADYETAKQRDREIEEKTIDVMRLGEMQPERDHNFLATDKCYSSEAFGRTGREVRDGGYFSFHMKVRAAGENALICTYLGDDKGREFDVLVDGTKIASQELQGGKSGKFYDIEYPVPLALTNEKSQVTITIQAHPG